MPMLACGANLVHEDTVHARTVVVMIVYLMDDGSRAVAVRAWFVMTASPVRDMEKYKQK